jgi:hypothetical protein
MNSEGNTIPKRWFTGQNQLGMGQKRPTHARLHSFLLKYTYGARYINWNFWRSVDRNPANVYSNGII